ncbi:M48 family metallopeptidase [Rhodospirillaceae bacterium SYSU D60014]|uniref:M48 family metalloprotease n=1 Tax=Virgifigura deserti TaxID=2268457 RepID=UPI000E662BBF
MSRIHLVTSAMLVALLGACAAPRTQIPDIDARYAASEAAKQKEIALRQQLEDFSRLGRVSLPILAGGVSQCENKRFTVGMAYVNSQSYDSEWRGAAAAILGHDSRLKVIQVVDGFPAAEGGLRQGDMLFAVNGEYAPAGVEALKKFSKLANAAIERDGVLELTVLRDNVKHTVRAVPREICDYPVEMTLDDQINAFADGKAIYVTRGMMRFATSDQELSLVIAHELAHNVMGHIDAKQDNAIAGGFGGLLLDILAAAGGVNTGGAFSDAGMKAGASSYSVEFEHEADYVGLYFMANAGLEIDGVANFWRRMATVNSGAISRASTHPTTPSRFLAIEAAVDEIKRKQTAGLPLSPTMKSVD